MSRKVAWSILLLLLTSVQSFALTCNTRCLLMAKPVQASTEHSMPGMEHCDMPTAPVHNGPAAQSMGALQVRSGITCCDDLSFAKDPGPAEQTDISLHALDNASITESAIRPAPIQNHDRPPAYSSMIQPSRLTPLISNLRI